VTSARPRHRIEGHAVFDKLDDSVACYERDGTVAYVNPVTCRIFGRPSEELTGQNEFAAGHIAGALRLTDGFPEWKAAGFPVETETQQQGVER